jgi:hypothetical protein
VFDIKNNESTGVVDTDPEVFGPPGSGSVIVCTDPDPSIIQQKNKENPDFYY